MNRRDFLLLRATKDREAELSCERLYMRYVDAAVDGTTARLFEALAGDLENADVVRLTDAEWLAHDDLNVAVARILAAFVARGGRVLGGTS
ncbi:MAG TPA: hypothetical protein VGY48_14585 [Vicinamibacterales bacterium]|jgi:hypothetical protein|nr:hypothetical protein [Vicinamibacterales bacterium]